jgi:hypothetical protein
LREQVEEMQQEISREEQQLQRLGLRQEDYQDVTYDRLLEQELETEIREAQFELESLKRNIIKRIKRNLA